MLRSGSISKQTTVYFYSGGKHSASLLLEDGVIFWFWRNVKTTPPSFIMGDVAAGVPWNHSVAWSQEALRRLLIFVSVWLWFGDQSLPWCRFFVDGFSCRSLRLTFWSHVLLSNVRALVSKCSIFSHGETVVLTLAQVWLLAKSCAMPPKAKAVAKKAKSKAEALAWAGCGILILPWQHFKGFFGLQKRVRILVQFLGSLLGASSVQQLLDCMTVSLPLSLAGWWFFLAQILVVGVNIFFW